MSEVPKATRSYWQPGDYDKMINHPGKAYVRPSYHMEHIKKYGNIYPKENRHEDICDKEREK